MTQSPDYATGAQRILNHMQTGQAFRVTVLRESSAEELHDRAMCVQVGGNVARVERLYLRVADAEKAMARQVADALGDESVSHTVRRLLREKHRELFGEGARRRATVREP